MEEWRRRDPLADLLVSSAPPSKCWRYLLLSGVLVLGIASCLWFICSPILYAWVQELRFLINIESEGFTVWKDNTASSSIVPVNPAYESFHLFHLTNLPLVLTGSKPNYQEKGPYTYKVIKKNFDSSWNDDSTQLTYRHMKQYHFQPSLSCSSCRETDVITNVNPAYVGWVGRTGGEVALLHWLGGHVVESLLDRIDQSYVEELVERQGLDYWLEECQKMDPECSQRKDLAKLQWR
eukprot:Lithocolla_globosa_v1_NODE_1675_length_2405_cov_6.857447.p2 type:complete len:236 gc:universal NODE_1675_length_2405_cov_6.857447:878-171(-)